MDAFITTILPWAGSYAPPGWVMCDGRLLQVQQYYAAFALLGTNYGGDGHTTFGVPNLKGRVLIGAGASPGTSSYSLGESDGYEKVTLDPATSPTHNHTANLNPIPVPAPVINASAIAATSHAPAAGVNTLAAPQNVGDLVEIAGFNNLTPDVQLNTGNSSFVVTGSVTLATTGGNMPFSVVQPYQTINYIMCLEGIFPPRN